MIKDQSMGPLQHSNLNQTVYMLLCNQLMRGDYPSGHVLNVNELAERFGTSVMPVREAVGKLVAQRALEPMKSRSVRIPAFSRERLEDIRRVRVLIEGTATQWATHSMNDDDIIQLEQMAQGLARVLHDPDGLAEGLDYNHKFHFCIYQATGSPTMLALIESLWLQSGAYLRVYRELMHSDERPTEEFHAAIAQAIKARDASTARHFMEQDINWPFERLLAAPEMFE